MEKRYKKALFIFRRDLRIEDNTGLIFALKNAENVIPCFIFTPEQIENNEYRSDHCLQFMLESLEDLQRSLQAAGGRLYLFFGTPDAVVNKLIRSLQVDLVAVNRDYTPYSIQRDEKISALCQKSAVSFKSFDDALLHPPEDTLKGDGKPYTIFTPFYRNASKLQVSLPLENCCRNYFSAYIPGTREEDIFKEILPHRLIKPTGGRAAALNILKGIESFLQYEGVRDFPAKDSTTHLSAHLKFTTCSVREIYWAICHHFGPGAELIRSLYWRDFFSSIAYYFPRVFTGAFHAKFDALAWCGDQQRFMAWCEGRTGFPIVDAGMRQLNETGFMHNRVRMIVASFLVKDLHIDWRWGEKYFAQKLVDYDPVVNNGNWQWAASTGCDAQPYFRIFNPWAQAMKFDGECLYIKRWLPEVAAIPPKVLHEWHLDKHQKAYPVYYHPIVEHSSQAKIALEKYKAVY